MRILFIDPSVKNIGWAVWEHAFYTHKQSSCIALESDLACYGLYNTKSEGENRFRELLSFPDYLVSESILFDRVVIELADWYDFSPERRKGHDTLKRATQAIADSFHVNGNNYEIDMLPVSEWKGNQRKSVFLNKAVFIFKAKKELIITNTSGKLRSFPDHVADAICMGDFYIQRERLRSRISKVV